MSKCERCAYYDTCGNWQKSYRGLGGVTGCNEYVRATFADRILRKNHTYKKAIEELRKDIDDLKSILKKQDIEIATIKRILEHCLTNNDYELKIEFNYHNDHGCIGVIEEKVFYIYYKGREYSIKLPEIFNEKLDMKSMFCNVLEGSVADLYIENVEHTVRHHFSIEFEVGRYIHTVKNLEAKKDENNI